jgi:hypothetical protein
MIDWRKLWRRLGVLLNLRDPPNLPHYGWSYFDHLVAVYVNLNTSDPRADAVIKKSHDRPDDLTWGDVFLLENINFSLMSPDLVDRSAWILRERFREIACPSIYEKYVGSAIPKETDTPAKLSLLRADLARVLDVLHWYYSLIPMRERIRRSLTIDCIAMVVAYTVALALCLAWCHYHNTNFLAMLACVLYCGIIGGFVSSQRRMQSIPSEGDPLIDVFGFDNAGYYLWLSPLLGAIFAVVLTLMFIAGVLKGSAFPDFSQSFSGHHDGLPFFYFTWNTLPKNSDEYAKLFVWAFLAGFAERLVPDSLDRLASKIDQGGGSSPASSPSRTAPPPPAAPLETPQEKSKITEATLQDALHSGEAPKQGE